MSDAEIPNEIEIILEDKSHTAMPVIIHVYMKKKLQEYRFHRWPNS